MLENETELISNCMKKTVARRLFYIRSVLILLYGKQKVAAWINLMDSMATKLSPPVSPFSHLCFYKSLPNVVPQKSSQDLLQKKEGERAIWEYPFAVAGVNITFMLIQMLDLELGNSLNVMPRTLVGATFLKLVTENESAFDLLYCITFKLMDHQWFAMHASYMDFNAVMNATRRQLERELLQEDITRLEELPSYSLLSR